MKSETTFDPFSPFEALDEGVLQQAIKTNIRGILDSYHGDFDFLIESLQNAVDAVEQRFDTNQTLEEAPRIEITLNYQTRRVRVSDNGIGMDETLARNILSPNFTSKPYFGTATQRSLRGHKGVGLTFLAFRTDLFRFRTKVNGEVTFAAELTGGNSWVTSDDNNAQEPRIVSSDYSPDFLENHQTGTSFEFRVDNLDRLPINWLGWYQIVRTSTAAAFCDINQLHPWHNRAQVRLTVVSSNGRQEEPPEGFSDQFPLEFFYPHTLIDSLDLDEFYRRHPAQITIPESEKNRYEAIHVKWDTDNIEAKLFEGGNIETGTDRHQAYLFTREHLPSIYALFTHSQRVWRDRLDVGLSPDRRRRFWRPGVQVISNQMPTGQLHDIALPYRAGNKERVLMLVELEGIKPDYGRKGFKSEVNTYLNHIATELISYFLANRPFLRPTAIAHGPTSADAEAEADSRVKSAESLPDLGLEGFSFVKEPQFENDVIALFMEMLAHRYIRGFEILSSSGGSQYDAVVNYKFTQNPQDLLHHAVQNSLGIPKSNLAKQDLYGKNLEFKKSLDSLIADFDEETKLPNQVRFAVSWDEGNITDSGYELVDLTTSGAFGQREFHGQTHRLVMEGSTIPVFMLKTIVDIARAASA